MLQVLNEIAIWYFIVSVMLAPPILYGFFRSLAFKRFRKWLGHKKYATVVFVNESNIPQYDVCDLQRTGNRLFIKDKDQQYGYEPIADRLAIIQNGNAIPYCIGGWVSEKVQKQALKEIDETMNPEDLEKPQNEDKLAQVYRWVVTHKSQELKNAVIRPLVKWSGKELNEAIQSKVVIELLRIPLELIDLIMIVGFVIIAGVSFYFGYQNNQILTEILNAVTKSPYTPIP